MSLKHYGMPEGPGRLEPWAVALLLTAAYDELESRLSRQPGPEPATF